MTTYDEKLALAKATVILTEEEAAATGGAYFDEDMGLWIRQDADGGGIMPFSWQMSMARTDMDKEIIRSLFFNLGRYVDMQAYDDAVAEAEASRGDYGLKE